MRACIAACAALMLPTAAMARDLCTERPGLGTPACTVEPGRVQIETGVADWTHERDSGTRIDTVTIAATEMRIGVAHATELQLSWTPYGYERMRDAAGSVERSNGTGDIRIGLKQNLANPDGHGFAAAVLPFATLPAGRQPIGAGDWGAGLIVPLTYDVSDAIQFELTSEVDAAVDADGQGRHLAYGHVVGVEWDPVQSVEITAEVQAMRDRDPSGHATQWLSGLSAAWQPATQLQFDLGTALGLDHDAPGLRVYGGFVTRF